MRWSPACCADYERKVTSITEKMSEGSFDESCKAGGFGIVLGVELAKDSEGVVTIGS